MLFGDGHLHLFGMPRPRSSKGWGEKRGDGGVSSDSVSGTGWTGRRVPLPDLSRGEGSVEASVRASFPSIPSMIPASRIALGPVSSHRSSRSQISVGLVGTSVDTLTQAIGGGRIVALDWLETTNGGA